MKISQDTLNFVLALYKSEQRLLKEAAIEYPKLYGKFLIGRTYYTLSPFAHATDIEIQLCLNQLAYVGIYEVIRLGLDEDLASLSFEGLQKEGMLIIESRKKFRKQIPTDREIRGTIKVEEKRKALGILTRSLKFDFEDRSCFGNLEIALLTKLFDGGKK